MTLLTLALACAPRPFLDAGECREAFDGPAIAACQLPDWPDRDYDLVLPDSYDGSTPVPLLLAIHGGGGNRHAAAKTTCSDGKVDDASCLHRHAQASGYAVAFPDGSGFGLMDELRTWNAGGGGEGWRCTSGEACQRDIDDIAYFGDLLDDIEGRVAVDSARVYATGLSNGGAMSHRLACQLSDRITAIAPVGGGMQYTTTAECAPTRPVPVLHVHGTADPAWRYEGGVPETVITGQPGLAHVSIERTLDEWAAILGCDGGTTEEALADSAQDGTTTTRLTWTGCAADLQHLRIDGGGHAWPDGDQYLGEKTIGPVPRDWGNQEIWDFLSAQVMPAG